MTIRRTFSIEIGRCGWGASGGLVPELRLGVVRIWTCDGGRGGGVEAEEAVTTDIYTVALAIYAGLATVAVAMLGVELRACKRALDRMDGSYQAARLMAVAA